MVFTKGKAREDFVIALKPENFVEQEQKIADYKLTLHDQEFELLDEFFAMIRREDPDIIIGYNIMGFDMKYILQKYYSLLRNIPQAGRMRKKDYLRDEIIHKSWNSSAYGVRECAIFNFVGRCCFDVYNYVSMELTMQKYSLDFISQELLGRQKLDMSYNEMFKKYGEGKVVEIADYCFVDSDLTLGIWEKLGLWIAAVEQCKLFKVDLHDMYSSGQQKRIFNQLYFYAHKMGYVFDKEPDFKHKFNYQGAHVLDPKPGIYRDCAVVDFASLYPSIIISRNICYTTLSRDEEGNSTFTTDFKGVIPEILEHLISSRKRVKKLMKDETDPIVKSIYDKRQFAYKVSANSFYGAFGSRNNHYLQMRDGAEAVTRNGRMFLMEAVDIINSHKYNCTVIYGDTDSCFFSGVESLLTQQQIFDIVNDVNASFPPPVHVEFEKRVDVLLLLAKKKYVFVSDGKQIAKGVITARRDTCLWVREVYKSVIDLVLAGGNNKEVNNYLALEMRKLYMQEVGMQKLYINRNLGINYKSKSYPLNIYRNVLQQAEKRNVPAGERLEFYYIKSNSKLQGYHYASRDMIESMDLEIDHEYYVDHQLKGPIVQIYDVLGWKFKKEE
ncbi:hypothetical protein GGI19_000341 [Coemansia pectinata]|uniref:DNA polymerase delta catalytic subunit n=1 Tax=Coemansia pectinata TaxID=1052879 RepID=A0A9W8GZR9_9FUNG|nr:hypothetical protein GGI19_000341 [Coemansia pectinata]